MSLPTIAADRLVGPVARFATHAYVFSVRKKFRRFATQNGGLLLAHVFSTTPGRHRNTGEWSEVTP